MGACCLGRDQDVANVPARFGGQWASDALAISKVSPGSMPGREALSLPGAPPAGGEYMCLIADPDTNKIQWISGSVTKGKYSETSSAKTYIGRMKEFGPEHWTTLDGPVTMQFAVSDFEYEDFEGHKLLMAFKINGTRIERMSLLSLNKGGAPIQAMIFLGEAGPFRQPLLGAVKNEKDRIEAKYAAQAAEAPKGGLGNGATRYGAARASEAATKEESETAPPPSIETAPPPSIEDEGMIVRSVSSRVSLTEVNIPAAAAEAAEAAAGEAAATGAGKKDADAT